MNIKNIYRKRQSKLFVHEILEQTTVPLEFIEKISNHYHLVGYHNFDHALMVSHGLLKMFSGHIDWILGKYCVATLGHDAGHQGIKSVYDEINAVHNTLEVFTPEIAKKVHSEEYHYLCEEIRDNIFATCSSAHRYYNHSSARTMQDADLSVWGMGLEYVLYSIFGLMDEFNQTSVEYNRTITDESDKRRIYSLEEFVHEAQVGFFEKITQKGRYSFYQSSYANKNLIDPWITLRELQYLDMKTIEKAYELRYEDITLQEFALEVLDKKIG